MRCFKEHQALEHTNLPASRVEGMICLIRGRRVMLDSHLAAMLAEMPKKPIRFGVKEKRATYGPNR